MYDMNMNTLKYLIIVVISHRSLVIYYILINVTFVMAI